MESGFYMGTVIHKRFQPKIHRFKYPLYMCYLNLDEVEDLVARHWWFSLKRWAPLQLKVSDYFKHLHIDQQPITHLGHSQLKQTILDMAQLLGADICKINKVTMLAHLRCFGVYFSPVNFYYLYADDELIYLLAEVSNTPWNKKHAYLVSMDGSLSSEKSFHVSPFMDLAMRYHWRVKPPKQRTSVRIESWGEQKLFYAQFHGKYSKFDGAAMLRIIFKWPIVALSVLKGIYWQAFRLWMKGIKYVPYQFKSDPRQHD